VAQWLGQFSGQTRATKVEEVEEALRRSVAVFRAASPADRGGKAKSVRNLAERLLSARLRLLKARLAALDPVADGREQNTDGVEALRARETQARADGVHGILAEFGALDALA
jgi:hypothetical protein